MPIKCPVNENFASKIFYRVIFLPVNSHLFMQKKSFHPSSKAY